MSKSIKFPSSYSLPSSKSHSCLFSIDGGTGKNVMFTSLLPYLKQKYSTIYSVSAYIDVFKCSPYVKGSYPMGFASLYQIVQDPDTDVLWREPYSNQKFIKKRCHLFQACVVLAPLVPLVPLVQYAQ